LPVVLVTEEMEIHPALLVAVQPHALGLVTPTLAPPPP
jgi:hypothetical protein